MAEGRVSMGGLSNRARRSRQEGSEKAAEARHERSRNGGAAERHLKGEGLTLRRARDLHSALQQQ